MAPGWVPFEIKIDVHVLPEPATVVVPVRLSISKCLHDLIGLYKHRGDPVRGEG